MAKLDPTTDLIAPESANHARIRRFRLLVVEGPDSGRSCVSQSDRLVIGSDPSTDLTLRDRTVSRFHCELHLERDGVLVRDLESRNGVQVDGVVILEARLQSGALLHIGHTQIRFELEDDHVEIPLSHRTRFGSMVGKSLAIRQAFAVLEQVANSDATVLIEGETGTGKEAVAESIHRESGRRDGPFVVVDCGAISSNLLESELFGHEAGAFTGAVGKRLGAFEEASGGTLFLDEVGELGPDLQPKLLRALERKEIKRIGSNKHFSVDVRIVAATNRNLRTEVNAGRFRSDLYYRLAVVEVRLPPLRGRKEDLPLLVGGILENLGVANRPEAIPLTSRSFLSELALHSWPGNVRELRNYLERCLLMERPPPLSAEAPGGGGGTIDTTQPWKEAREGWLRDFEKRYLEELMRTSQGNVTAGARAAGIDRVHFHRLLKRHGLR